MNVKELQQILIFMERYQFDLLHIIGTKVGFKEYDGDGFITWVYDIRDIIKSNKPII